MDQKDSSHIFLQDHVQKLLDDFASILKVRIVLYSPDGVPLRQGGKGDVSPFCQLVRKEYFPLEKCLKQDREMQKKCAATGKCHSYKCHAGCYEAVMPLIAPRGELLGFLMFGQYRTSAQLPASMKKHVAESPEKERRLLRVWKLLPSFPGKSMENMTGLLELLVDYILRCELVSDAGNDPFFSALQEYIERHYKEEISIHSAAKALGKSVSSISHTLQTLGHGSFQQLLTRRRLESATHLLLEERELCIKEVGEKCGFSDPYYFSRVFRKYKNLSPKAYRESHGKSYQKNS